MRAVTVCALAALLFSCHAAAAPTATVEAGFEAFKLKHNKKYASAAEEAKRFKIFAENMHKAAELEKLHPHAKFGANVFADLSEEEFSTRLDPGAAAASVAAGAPRVKVAPLVRRPGDSIDGVDWRLKHAVTPVHDQGACNVGWAFATADNIASAWFIAGHTANVTEVSVQQLVSCTPSTGEGHGCRPATSLSYPFDYIIHQNHGAIATAASYPYTSGRTGEVPACNASGKPVGARVDGVEVWTMDDGLRDMVAKFPVATGVNASGWQLYRGGIFEGQCPAGYNHEDHFALVVGYSFDSMPPYWIIKNSWGTDWGEDGYIRISFGVECDIISLTAMAATVPRA